MKKILNLSTNFWIPPCTIKHEHPCKILYMIYIRLAHIIIFDVLTSIFGLAKRYKYQVNKHRLYKLMVVDNLPNLDVLKTCHGQHTYFL